MNRTKLGLITLILLAGTVTVSRLINSDNFDFSVEQNRNDPELEKIMSAEIRGAEGSFAVYIEELPSSPSATLKNPKKYALNELEVFPAASLYKLVLLAAVFKELENGPPVGGLKLEDVISSTKSHLEEVFGGVDFGYEEAPEKIEYSVDEALARVGRISDNFAAIMLTEKLRAIRLSQGSSNKLLVEMAKELGMVNTDFDSDPINTTASDIAIFFRKLYLGQIISPQASEQILKYLSLSQLNNRIPAGVAEGVKVVHKTGELARARHDAGIVYLNSEKSQESRVKSNYLIVLLSKNLKYEDDGVEVLANISKEVYKYFNK